MIPSSRPRRLVFWSSNGPERRAKESRKYNPVKSTRKRTIPDEDEHEDGWDATLVRFQDKLHDIVHNGQPPGGLSPEMALAAKITQNHGKKISNDQ
jgi:type II secretory pathway component PulJ